jgi:hypothetical protein
VHLVCNESELKNVMFASEGDYVCQFLQVRQGAASVRAGCRVDGGPERRLAAQREAGAVQPRSVHLSVAALTGPPTAALTGVPIRPFVRESLPPTAHAPPGGYQPRTSEGRPGPLLGQTAAPGTEPAPGLASRSCPHVLGTTARTSGRTGAISGAWA